VRLQKKKRLIILALIVIVILIAVPITSFAMGQMMFKSPVEQEIESTIFANSGNASDHIFTMNNWRDFSWALLSSGIKSKF
jgi:flagellar basal body-associated protein FliL